MWPPSRSEARSASSRLTSAPAATSASEERRSVSCITSARNAAVGDRGRGEADAVDRDGVALGDLAGQPGAHGERHAVVGGVDRVDRAEVLDEPGEHAHHSRSRAEISTSSAIRSTSSASARVASAIRSTPSPSSGSRALEPPTHDRREEQADLVDLAGVEERAGELRPALEQDRRDAGGAELVERGAHPRRLVLARGDDHVGAGDLERVGLQARARRARRRRSAAARARPRTSWESSGSRPSESNTTRRGWRGDALDPRVELRVVGERGADPDDDGVALGAPVVRAQPRGLAGDPLRVAGARRDLAVERHRRLEEHVRAARARVLAERLVEQPRAHGGLAVGDDDLDALVAQDARARGRRPSRSGRRRRRRRGAIPASRIASVQGGVCPWWQQGSSETYSVAPRGSARAGGERLALGVRARRRRRGSPRPAPRPSRTTTAPTSGLGLTRPRPPSASSIARARWASVSSRERHRRVEARIRTRRQRQRAYDRPGAVARRSARSPAARLLDQALRADDARLGAATPAPVLGSKLKSRRSAARPRAAAASCWIDACDRLLRQPGLVADDRDRARASAR